MPAPFHPHVACRSHRRSQAPAVILGSLLFSLPGCSSPPSSTDAPPTSSRRSTASRAPVRLDAAWGRIIVLPAHSLPFQSPASNLIARADDGQPVTIEWRTLVVTPGRSPAMPPTQRRGWLPPVGEWSTSTNAAAPSADPDGAVSARFAVLTLPPGTLGQGVWLTEEGSVGAGTRLEVNWLPSSRTLADRSKAAAPDGPFSPEVAASPLVRAALDAEGTSPFRRWRSRLAQGLLRPTEGTLTHPGDEPSPTSDQFTDPALEQIAAQIEERWAVALALLAEADAAMAARVRTSLLLTAQLGGGIIAPMWTTDQAVLDELLAGLLAPRIGPKQRVATAEMFLRKIPGASARITDDAHALDGKTLAPVVVITATNLSDSPLAASAIWPRSFAPADLTPVPPRSSARLVLPADAESIEAKPATASVIVGDWRGTLRASPLAAAVVPPGLFLGPFLPDLSKDEWLLPPGSDASSSPPVAVTILRAPSPSPRDRAHSEGWVLYGESAPGATGTLKIWFGTLGAGRTPMIVELGAAIAAPSPNASAPDAPTQAARRTFSIPVPPDAVTKGRLILGLDASIVVASEESHWAWPRAMFPWQTAPSRAALDLTTWGGVAEPATPVR